MRLSDLLSMSIESLFKRKVRTILTILGVIIGTISIVVMMSLGVGMKAAILEEMSSYGALTSISVYVNEWGDDDEKKLHLDEEAVETFSNIPNVEYVSPAIKLDVLIKYGSYLGYTTLVGLDEEGLERMDFAVEAGDIPRDKTSLELFIGNMVITQFYNPNTYYYPYYDSGEPVDVDMMKDTMFLILDMDGYYAQGSISATGQPAPQVRKRVISTSGLMAGGLDTYSEGAYNVYCNIDALRMALKKDFKNRAIPGQPLDKNGKPYKDIYYNIIYVYADSMENVTSIQEQINSMGYSTEAMAEWIESDMNTINVIQYALGGIGAVSLFVAAIGIINTMMMSIYERTKEIGIMKVLGCKLHDIQTLFLFEAGFIGFIGGAIGIGLSYLISGLINKAMASSDMGMGNISVIPPWLAIVSLVFAVLIGMIAGFIPSLRAMKLSPLEALRN